MERLHSHRLRGMPKVGDGKFCVAMRMFHFGKARKSHGVVWHGVKHFFGQFGHGNPVAFRDPGG